MKKIGIVGGVGWRSTVEYYEGICRRSEKRHRSRGLNGLPSIPEMTIESLDLKRAVAYLGNDLDLQSWERFDRYHHDALRRLEQNGAEFAVMASNTPHHRFTEIVTGLNIPVIDMFEVVAMECVRQRITQLLILGTPVTMTSPGFREVLSSHGVLSSCPDDDSERTACKQLISELQAGHTRGGVETINGFARSFFGPCPPAFTAVCLACTELPLAFPGQKALATFERNGIIYINSTAAHIDAAFAYACSSDLSLISSEP